MIITNKKNYATKARYLINQAKKHSQKFIHEEIGYNFRISNIHAAIGCAQINKLNHFIKKKKYIHQIYKKKFIKCKNIKILEPLNFVSSNYWLNIIFIDFKKIKISRDQIINKMQKKNIEIRPIWYLNHLQKPYKNSQNYKIYKSKELVNNSLCLPSSATLEHSKIELIANELLKIVK